MACQWLGRGTTLVAVTVVTAASPGRLRRRAGMSAGPSRSGLPAGGGPGGASGSVTVTVVTVPSPGE